MKTFRRFLLPVFALMSVVMFAASPLVVETASGNTPDAASVSTSAVLAVPDVELTFIDMMITHHATAIAMSTLMLTEGEHPELMQFARQVIMVQEKEVVQLGTWRNAWYPDADAVTTSQLMMATAGMSMRDPALAADMLRSTSGPLDQAFINAMILHDMTSVMMAEMIVPLAENPELANLAQVIVDRQETEIDQLRAWRDAWYGVDG